MTSTHFLNILTPLPSLSAKSLLSANLVLFLDPLPLLCGHHLRKPPYVFPIHTLRRSHQCYHITRSPQYLLSWTRETSDSGKRACPKSTCRACREIGLHLRNQQGVEIAAMWREIVAGLARASKPPFRPFSCFPGIVRIVLGQT